MDDSEKREDSYVGRLIAGRYAVVKKLNQGGMGAVYLAIQRPLDRPVAVKVLLKTLREDPTAAKRFEKEARSVSRLTHPNVITIYDFFATEQEELYIAMEYLKGKSLREMLDESGYMTSERALHIIRGVTSGLVAAHKAGIVHRDLKPENVVLVERNGDADFPKVLDFGLARSIETEQDNTITQRDTIPGTPAYLPPERTSGVAGDPRSDLYSLGAMWWELLVGKPPFEAENSIRVILKHIHEAPRAPSQANPENNIPAAVEKLVLELLEKQPARRPASADALLERIEALYRPRGWHVSAATGVGRASDGDNELQAFAAAIGDLDELEFSSLDEEEEEPILLVKRKVRAATETETVISTDGPPERPTWSETGGHVDPPVRVAHHPSVAELMPAPTAVIGTAPPVAAPPPILDAPRTDRTHDATTTNAQDRPPERGSDGADEYEELGTPRDRPPAPGATTFPGIASISEASAYVSRARTAREIAELAVAFLSTMFERAAVVELKEKGPEILAANGFFREAALGEALGGCGGMHALLFRRDAYYGPAANTPEWLVFFRALGGQLPGSMYVATLKRRNIPSFLFYGDHRDPGRHDDVRDTLQLLREAASALARFES